MSKARRIKKLRSHLTKTQGPVYALVYCRVSSERQAAEGHGLDSQELRCREYAARKNYEVDAVFKDTATGGGAMSFRQGQVDILDHIDKLPHRNFVVLVDDISRLARDVVAHFGLREALRQRGVEIESPNFNFDSSPEGSAAEGMMAVISEYHRKNNRRQVIQKQKARLELGYWSFGARKGYTMVKKPEHGKISIPNKEGLEMLKPAFEKFATGQLVRKIDVCRYLVERGFWKNQIPEKYIDKLASMLKDPFYCGDVEYPAWEVERRVGKHEGIISRETFALIQKRIRKEDTGIRIRVDVSDDFALRGLLVCADCGNHLTGAWSQGRSKRYGYYVCKTKECKNYGKSANKDEVQKKFNAMLKKHKLKKGVDKIVHAAFDSVWTDKIATYEKQENLLQSNKQELQQKIRQITEMIFKAKSENLKRMYEDQLEQMAKEFEELEEGSIANIDLSVPYRTANEKALKMLKSPYKIWTSLDLIEKRKFFYFIFEEKLPYDIKGGYRTDKIPTAVRLFEDFAVAKPHDVEMGEIESPCRRFLQRSLHT